MRHTTGLGWILAGLLLAGPATAEKPPATGKGEVAAKAEKPSAKAEAAAAKTAAAEIHDGSGKKVGMATLTEAPHGVVLNVELMDLQPGPHAFHIHEVGKCEAPGFKSAGGHFNPMKKHHGVMNPEGMHEGDLPNVEVPASGTIKVQVFVPGATLTGPQGILDGDGAALVLHKTGDDLKTDPAGNAGDRIACGVIEMKK
jgi:Cu-Zn family superoxide dismutase